MKGRRTHHHRLHPQAGKSGERIEEEAISHAESGKAAEGDSLRRAGGRVRRRRGGAVPGRKPPRRIDKQARASTLKPGGPPSYQGPTKPTMPFSGAEAKDVPATYATDTKAQGEQEPEYRRKGGGIHIRHPGRLHERLGVPQGQKIPASKIAKAKRSADPSLRKEATFAQNAKKFHH